MFYFGKFKKYYKDFLVQLIEGKVDFNKYPYSTIQDKEIYHCSEEEISELKKELIPLLEKIEAEGKIFVNPYYYFHHYTPEKGVGGKNFVKYCCNQNGILMKLFDLLDWYPNKFGVYGLVFPTVFWLRISSCILISNTLLRLKVLITKFLSN